MVEGDALAAPLHGVVHADPGRRDARGRRLVALDATRPPTTALVARWRAATGAAALAVSASPAVALDDPGLPADAEVAFLEVDGRLVDAVVLLGPAVVAGSRRAVLLAGDGAVVAEHVGLPSPTPTGRGPLDGDAPVDATDGWLVEARPALVRARLHEDLGRAHGLVRASRRRALLLAPPSPTAPAAAPWFTARRVLADLPGRGRALRRWLADAPRRPVEVVLHGARIDPLRLLRDAGNPSRGPDGYRAELVRTDAGVRLLVTDAGVAT